MHSPLLESYRQDGLNALQRADQVELLLDHNFCLGIIPLVVERDDEPAFDFMMEILWGWGVYYKGLVRSSLHNQNTKYLEKIIASTQLMLLEEVDSDDYNLEEVEIVVRAYLVSTPFQELYNLLYKGPTLTQALDKLQVDV